MKYVAGDVIEVRVMNIKNYGAFCKIGSVTGLIHISEFSDYFVRSIEWFVKVADFVKVEVLSYNENNQRLKLSFKSIRPELQKAGNQKIQETNRGFISLKRKYVDQQKEK